MTKGNDKERDALAGKRKLEVQNYTRTERHLEQHADIGDPKGKAHAMDIQKAREAEIQQLKNTIVYGDAYDDHPLENLKENIDDTKEYVEQFGSKMDEETLQNIKEKQKNREDNYDQLRFR